MRLTGICDHITYDEALIPAILAGMVNFKGGTAEGGTAEYRTAEGGTAKCMKF